MLIVTISYYHDIVMLTTTIMITIGFYDSHNYHLLLLVLINCNPQIIVHSYHKLCTPTNYLTMFSIWLSKYVCKCPCRNE